MNNVVKHARANHALVQVSVHDELVFEVPIGERIAEIRRRKAEERAVKDDADPSALADIPLALPGLSRLQKLQKRADKAGLKAPGPHEVLDRIALKVDALRDALRADQTLTEDQVGELLFDCVSLSRQVKVDAERAARMQGREFDRVFRALEGALEAQEEALESLDRTSQQRYWHQVKQASN